MNNYGIPARLSATPDHLSPSSGEGVPTAMPGTVPSDGPRQRARSRPPRRRKNVELRSREHLTPSEVEQLIQAAQRRGRYVARDAAVILLCYRHRLRVRELVALRWERLDLAEGLLHLVSRNSAPRTDSLDEEELRLLRKLKRGAGPSRYVFITERGGPMTAAGFRKMLARTGEAGNFGFSVHPQMLHQGWGHVRSVPKGHHSTADSRT